MGAESFMTKAKGKTAKEAFAAAQEQARYDHGHSGYTGTIAEKTKFVVIVPTTEYEKLPEKFAEKLMDDCDARIDDKWGPAGCVSLGNNEWLFFGWASS